MPRAVTKAHPFLLLSGSACYHFNSSRGAYITAALIRSRAGDLDNTSIWCCGPGGFVKCIMQDLRSMGFNMRNFHYDSFCMR